MPSITSPQWYHDLRSFVKRVTELGQCVGTLHFRDYCRASFTHPDSRLNSSPLHLRIFPDIPRDVSFELAYTASVSSLFDFSEYLNYYPLKTPLNSTSSNTPRLMDVVGLSYFRLMLTQRLLRPRPRCRFTVPLQVEKCEYAVACYGK